jgi:hypothetical protein
MTEPKDGNATTSVEAAQAGAKRLYERPKLTRYGSIAEITRNLAAGADDGLTGTQLV